MSKKNEKKWTQIGGFLFGIEKTASDNRMVVKNTMNNWRLMWSDDTMMFGIIISLLRNENAHEYLHSLMTIMYVVTTYPHDLVALMEKSDTPFMKGVADLIDKQNDYEQSLRPQPTEEENAKAIDEMKRMAEMAQEAMEVEKEENGNGGDNIQQ